MYYLDTKKYEEQGCLIRLPFQKHEPYKWAGSLTNGKKR